MALDCQSWLQEPADTGRTEVRADIHKVSSLQARHGAAAAAAAKSLQSCPTLRPHRRQPTRLSRPWDSPGKNTGVGCHFLPQCMKVKSESEVTQSCPTLSDPMDCSLPGSSVHGSFQYWSGLPLPSLKHHFREMQIKTPMTYYFIIIRRASIQNKQRKNKKTKTTVYEDVE